MKETREEKRHKKVMEQIKNATCIKELPNLSESTITSSISSLFAFNGEKFPAGCYKPIVDCIINHGTFDHPTVKKVFVDTIYYLFKDVYSYIIEKVYDELNESKKIDNILIEMQARREKVDFFNAFDNYEKHKNMMNAIKGSYSVDQFPRVGVSELNREIVKTLNNNRSCSVPFKQSNIKLISDAYLYGKDFNDVEEAIKKFYNAFPPKFVAPSEESLIAAFRTNEVIDYIVEEIKAKDEMKNNFYQADHEYTMQKIKSARRMFDLPTNISEAVLTNYLHGNSTIYPNDKRMTYSEFKYLTTLLVKGYSWDSHFVIEAIKYITNHYYPCDKEAFKLLYDKLRSLPKTKYLIEEINAINVKNIELATRRDKKVKFYLRENKKNPLGNFHDIYLSRSEEELDYDQILKDNNYNEEDDALDILTEYDPTIKRCGGLCLYKDEYIGDITTYRENDGSVGISPEEKAKMDRINDLDASIKEKEAKLKSLNTQYKVLSSRLYSTVNNYKQKATLLSQELMDSIVDIENSIKDNKKRN